MSVFPLRGVVQHYAWGGTRFLPDLLQQPNEQHESFAEWWMGTHVKGPSNLRIGNEWASLPDLIADQPVRWLGAKTAADFDQRLPFLFKILDVNRMLSIQAHPTKAVAERGFAREEATGIAVTAPNRTYRDDNHKPEIMVALTDFWLLHGFRPLAEINQLLERPEFRVLRPFHQIDDIQPLYQYLMELPQKEVDGILEPLWQSIRPAFERGELTRNQADYWAAQAFVDYTQDGHYDRGIFSIYLFNLVFIPTGKAIYQAAGVPHAYLEGVNVELMANSDNVFRGGLTQKHIDVPELMANLHFESVEPIILSGEQQSDLERVFKTPAPDFELSQIDLKEGNIYRNPGAASAEIWMVLEGEVATQQKETESIGRGNSFFVAAGTDYTLRATKKSQLFKAAVPQ